MHPALLVVARILSWLLPKDHRDSLLGDLAEEHALRVEMTSPGAALLWYLREICRSTLPLLWARLTRGTWLSMLGVALLAYFAVGVAQLLIRWGISSTLPAGYRRLDVIIVFPMVVLIGYVAERLRRRAALLLGAMMLIAITAMTMGTAESLPLWYRVAWFVVGPAAALAGSVLPSLRRGRH